MTKLNLKFLIVFSGIVRSINSYSINAMDDNQKRNKNSITNTANYNNSNVFANKIVDAKIEERKKYLFELVDKIEEMLSTGIDDIIKIGLKQITRDEDQQKVINLVNSCKNITEEFYLQKICEINILLNNIKNSSDNYRPSQQEINNVKEFCTKIRDVSKAEKKFSALKKCYNELYHKYYDNNKLKHKNKLKPKLDVLKYKYVQELDKLRQQLSGNQEQFDNYYDNITKIYKGNKYSCANKILKLYIYDLNNEKEYYEYFTLLLDELKKNKYNIHKLDNVYENVQYLYSSLLLNIDFTICIIPEYNKYNNFINTINYCKSDSTIDTNEYQNVLEWLLYYFTYNNVYDDFTCFIDKYIDNCYNYYNCDNQLNECYDIFSKEDNYLSLQLMNDNSRYKTRYFDDRIDQTLKNLCKFLYEKPDCIEEGEFIIRQVLDIVIDNKVSNYFTNIKFSDNKEYNSEERKKHIEYMSNSLDNFKQYMFTKYNNIFIKYKGEFDEQNKKNNTNLINTNISTNSINNASNINNTNDFNNTNNINITTNNSNNINDINNEIFDKKEEAKPNSFLETID